VHLSRGVGARRSGLGRCRGAEVDRSTVDRSPVDVAVSADGRWLVTANETSNSLSVIDIESRKVVQEIACGRRPAAVVFRPISAACWRPRLFGGTACFWFLTPASAARFTRCDWAPNRAGLRWRAMAARPTFACLPPAKWRVVDLTAFKVESQIDRRPLAASLCAFAR